MTEMEVKDNKFFVVDTEQSKWILDNEKDAIEKMKKIVKEEEIEIEKIAIFSVNTEGKEWKIKQVPWSKIVAGLIKKEE